MQLAVSKPKLQRAIYLYLRSIQKPYAAAVGLQRRVLHLIPGIGSDHGTFLQAWIQVVGKLLGPGLAFSSVKIMCNGLNTSARYRNTAHGGLLLDCKFCWHIGGDNVRHYLVCPRCRSAFEEEFGPLRLPVLEEDGVAFFCWADQPNSMEIRARAILADLIVKAYQEMGVCRYHAIIRCRIRNSIKARISHWLRGGRASYGEGLDFLRSDARRQTMVG